MESHERFCISLCLHEIEFEKLSSHLVSSHRTSAKVGLKDDPRRDSWSEE